MDLVIALDIGTTNLKATIVNGLLEAVHKEEIRIPSEISQPHYHEQDANVILELSEGLLRKSIRKAGSNNVRAICLSSAMHSLLAVDQDHRPLCPAMTWQDQRAGQEFRHLKEKGMVQSLYEKTLVPIHPILPLLKIMWLRDHKAKVFKKALKFLSIKDYILSQWTGRFYTDYSSASATGLFNPVDRKWDPASLKEAGITADHLPEPVGVKQEIPVRKGWCQRFSLRDDVKLITGSADGVLATTGPWMSTNTLSVGMGTSAAIRMFTTKPSPTVSGRSFSYLYNKNEFVVGSATNNGGNVLQWYYESRVQSDEPFKGFFERAIEYPDVESLSLMFHPYVFGERAPLRLAGDLSAFTGLESTHDAFQKGYAVLEGLILNLKVNRSFLPPLSNEEVIANGGAFRINGLAQLVANVFNCSVKLPVSEVDLSSLGAAYLAMQVINPGNLKTTAINCTTYDPDPQKVPYYEEKYVHFLHILKSKFMFKN